MRQNIPTLTGLRFFAALGVVIFHFRWHVAAMFPAIVVAEPVLSMGRLGVDLFFTLSGFILTYTYVEWFRAPTLDAYLRFLGLRLARIYPVHLFTLVLILLATVYAAMSGLVINHPENYEWDEFALNLLLLHAWVPTNMNAWNYPSWSISAEWFAYLLFPLLIVGIAKIRSARVALVGAVLTYAVQLVVLPGGLGWNQDHSPILRISGEFLAGCFVAQAYLLGWGRAIKWGYVALLTTLLLVLVTPQLPATSGGPRIFVVPLFTVLVLALAYQSRGTAWLGWGPLVFWGEASYALYMTHSLIEVFGAKLFPMASFATSSTLMQVAILAIYAVFIFGSAALTYLLVERPARSALRQALASRASRTATRSEDVVPLAASVTGGATKNS